MSMRRATTQQCTPKCTPSIISATRSRLDRSAATISASAFSVAATTCGPADLLVASAVPHSGADHLQPYPVAAGGQRGQHALHRHLAEQLGARKQLIGRDQQCTGAVGGPDPRPGVRVTGHPAATEGRLPTATL